MEVSYFGDEVGWQVAFDGDMPRAEEWIEQVTLQIAAAIGEPFVSGWSSLRLGRPRPGDASGRVARLGYPTYRVRSPSRRRVPGGMINHPSMSGESGRAPFSGQAEGQVSARDDQISIDLERRAEGTDIRLEHHHATL